MYTYMYILYMQVFNRCHAVTKLVFAEVSVYIYMYLQVVLYICIHTCEHIHSLSADAEWVSRSGSVV